MKPQLIDIPFENKRTIQVKKVDAFYLTNPLHFHHLCELVWIEQSFGKRIIGDHVDNFSDGDLVLMSPDLPHIWQNDAIYLRRKKGYRAKAIVIYFPADILSNLSDEPAVIQPTQELIRKASRGLKFFGQTHATVTAMLKEIGDSAGLKKILYFLNIIETLSHSTEYESLASISYKNAYGAKDTDRINIVYQFVMHNFHRAISLEEIADITSMSPSAFSRYFKSRTQKSFVQFLNEIRIGHACKLLHNEEYSVSDVCYECGYNNLTNFNKFFKIQKKMTPSEYRKTILLV
jgi:AraC-like DNA-binding protein